MCCLLVDSNGKVHFDESEHPWTSVHVSTDRPSATKHRAEILQQWEHDHWKNIDKNMTSRPTQ